MLKQKLDVISVLSLQIHLVIVEPTIRRDFCSIPARYILSLLDRLAESEHSETCLAILLTYNLVFIIVHLSRPLSLYPPPPRKAPLHYLRRQRSRWSPLIKLFVQELALIRVMSLKNARRNRLVTSPQRQVLIENETARRLIIG